MKPGEILDAKRDLMDRLTSDSMFAKFTAIAAQDVAWGAGKGQPHADLQGSRVSDMNNTPEGWAWVRGLTVWVRMGESYRVTPDMCAVLNHAANSLDEEDAFDHSLAPTPYGMVRFEDPIRVIDARGKTMLVHWAVWGPTSRGQVAGMAFAFYNDTYTQADEVWSEFLEVRAKQLVAETSLDEEQAIRELDLIHKSLGRWSSVHQTFLMDGQPLGPSLVTVPDLQRAWSEVSEAYEPIEAGAAATNLFRHMHALWLLLNQTIVETDSEHVERHARKRAERAGMPGRVTVIRLRRSKGNRSEGESLIEWRHRWIVRGHWRWQACSEHHPLAQEVEPGKWRARLWIAPFVKGPEDAPFMQSEKLYSLEK